MTSEISGELPGVRARIVKEALSWKGTPYRHQQATKGVGCDCLGLVRGVWQAVYGDQPERPTPYSADWAETRDGDPLIEAAHRHCRPVAGDPAAGDLLIFRWRSGVAAKHCGILVSQTHFIHAYQGIAVSVSALVPAWRRRIAAVFAFPER